MELVVIMDLIGWVGAACFLIAYVLTTRIPGTSDTLHFHVLNLAGGICFAANAYYYGTMPLTVLNVIWIFLGTYAVIKILRKPKTAS